jgi:hypothetical protein
LKFILINTSFLLGHAITFSIESSINLSTVHTFGVGELAQLHRPHGFRIVNASYIVIPKKKDDYNSAALTLCFPPTSQERTTQNRLPGGTKKL